MADSTITKRALAAALKELMKELPFGKISISDICEKCNMSRKSFYYHFKDKYDLVNWIFDTEFTSSTGAESFVTGWDFLEELCNFFYSDKNFYRKALQIKGQNSFKDHFREFLLPLELEYLKPLFPSQQFQKFYINFFADAFICSIERWILEKDCMPPCEFLEMLKSCVQITAVKISQEMEGTHTELFSEKNRDNLI